VQFGSYQTLPELQPQFWNLIRFNETQVNDSFAWLMRKDQCMHCAEPGCPFNIPKLSKKTAKVYKCTLCIDRVSVGLELACIKACPIGCLQFGSKSELLAAGQKRVDQLKANGLPNAGIYDPPGVGGTGVVTVLAHADKPELYRLPKDPTVPMAVTLWKHPIKWIGNLGMVAGVLIASLLYLRYGPKHVPEEPKKIAGAAGS
jgi:formate dehydrogenase beta subunit